MCSEVIEGEEYYIKQKNFMDFQDSVKAIYNSDSKKYQQTNEEAVFIVVMFINTKICRYLYIVNCIERYVERLSYKTITLTTLTLPATIIIFISITSFSYNYIYIVPF